MYSVARPIPVSAAIPDIVTDVSPCSATSFAVAASTASRTARRCVGKMGRPQRHRPRAHGGSGGPPEVLHAECSETEGSIVLNWGRCALKAGPGNLTLRADAADEENLTRIQDMIAGRWRSSAAGKI